MKTSFAVSIQKTQFGAIAFGESFQDIASTLKSLDYEGIELAIRDPQSIDQEKIINTVKELELAVPAIGTGQAFIEEGLSLSSLDNKIWEKAVARLKEHILFASHLNSIVIIGLLRGNLPTETEKEKRNEALERFKKALIDCGKLAQKKGVKIVVEPLNRYEVNFLHTIEETLQFLQELGVDNIGILADSFHMNIEEVDLYQSIVKANRLLWHFHIADSNRWAPGFGHLDFKPLMQALQEINYQGFISAEIIQKPSFLGAARQTSTYLKNLLSELRLI